ncbi:hypothetical protein LOAG_02220 [Loa loa]|uniref:Uncharacterized protein n=1 Tax=Loa loa TaxID=7209 RepID=A0A1S0U728_LOALO|nr:hypothetical protein LOAG_02220 [Loa loa]EFO26262.1 hypothetical protein LOAG_02220 [Loa loa]
MTDNPKKLFLKFDSVKVLFYAIFENFTNVQREELKKTVAYDVTKVGVLIQRHRQKNPLLVRNDPHLRDTVMESQRVFNRTNTLKIPTIPTLKIRDDRSQVTRQVSFLSAILNQ